MSFPPNLGITSSFIIHHPNSSGVFQDLSFLLPPLDLISSPFSRAKMSGYSRLGKDMIYTRSKSVDFAELSYSTTFSKFKSQETKMNINNAVKTTTIPRSIPEDASEEGNGEVLGIIVSQQCSPPFSSSEQKPAAEEKMEASKLQSAAKRTVFIKRSASVSEGYSRINHQTCLAADGDDQNGTEISSQNRHKKKKGKFLKACRRLFGL